MKRLLSGGLAGVLLIATGVLAAPTATAAPVDRTIAYDCDLPIFGQQTLDIAVGAGIPATATVGTPVQLTSVTVVVPLRADLYDAFRPFGATQVDGDLALGIVIGGVSVPVTWTGSPTPIPDPSGPDLPLVFHGSVPPVTPGSAGVATVALGSTFDLRFTPRDASGNPTTLGTLDLVGTAAGDTFLGAIVVS